MKKWLFTILFGSALVLGACGGGADDTDDGAADTGDGGDTTETAGAAEEIYKDSCASCHGGDLSGGMGPELTGNGLSADEISNIIENGQGSMPPVNLSEEDRSEVANWLSNQ